VSGGKSSGKSKKLPYERVLLKLSGNALRGTHEYGIDPERVAQLAGEMHEVSASGIALAVVVGGGNIIRGEQAAAGGMDRATADQMGMLATVINALALQDALERLGEIARVASAIEVSSVCEPYIRRRVIRHLEKRRVVVLAGGTGNPSFTTDTAAALRALETGADVLLKATNVDGIYSADPAKDPKAERYARLTHAEAFRKRLRVMDPTAFSLCMDRALPIRVFDLSVAGNVVRAARGEDVGTLVSKEE